MQAVIVAAGIGSRLKPLTDDRPKALLEVSGESLIRRCVRQLQDCGIGEIAVVVGHHREMIVEHLRDAPVAFIHNPFYEITNNMVSLWFAQGFIRADFVYLHGDVILDPALLQTFLEEESPNALLVEKKPCDKEAMKVQTEGSWLVASSKELPLSETFGEWTGLAKFSAAFAETLFARIGRLIEQGQRQAYDALAFTELAADGAQIGIVDFAGLPWVEIDTEQDYLKARQLFEDK